MDYTARYGLEFNPFLKNSKEVLVETQEYKEVLFLSLIHISITNFIAYLIV